METEEYPGVRMVGYRRPPLFPANPPGKQKLTFKYENFAFAIYRTKEIFQSQYKNRKSCTVRINISNILPFRSYFKGRLMIIT